MKKFLVLFAILANSIFTFNTFAKHEMGASLIGESLTLSGKDKTTGGEGTLASNSNLNLAFSYTWYMTKRLHFKLNYYARKLKFKEDNGNIEGSDSIDSNLQEVGLRYVLYPKIAFSIYNVSETDVAFVVNSSNKIELVSSSLSFIRLFFHHILIPSRRVNIGYDLTYDLNSSTDLIKNRSAIGGDIFILFGKQQLKSRVYFGTRKITKETDDLDFTQTSSLFGASLTYIF